MEMDEITHKNLRPAGELTRTLYRALGTHPADRFKRWALDRLAEVIPFDSAFWVEGAEWGRVIFDAHLQNTRHLPEVWLADYAGLKGTDPLADAVAANPGITIQDTDVMAREAWLAHPVFGPFCRKHEIQYTLCTAAFDPVTSLVEVISIYRSSPDAPFSEQERQRMQFLFPHLAEARQQNRLAVDLSPGFEGMALCDAQGKFHYLGGHLESLLRGAFPHWRGRRLPEEINSVLDETAGPVTIGSAQSLFQAGRRDGLVLLALGALSPLERLSQRERQIAEVLAAGCTYQEGADLLEISVSTFNKHASRIYGKLGINGRVALAALLRGDASVRAGGGGGR